MPNSTFPLAGRPVNRVGYGAMQLVPRGRPGPTDAEAVELLHAIAELGVDHIDTAEFYGEGRVNGMLRAAFPEASASPLIATKIGARHVSGAAIPLVAAQRPHELREQVEQNLRSLGRDRLDLVYLRRADAAPGITATGEQLVPLADQLAELVGLRDAGLIGAIGLSNVSAEQLAEALPAGVAAVQNAYSVLDRSAEPALALARANGIAWVPFFPLGSGFAGTPSVGDLPAVVSAASDLGVTPEQVALAWLLADYEGTLLIPGSLDLAHVRQNLAVEELDLAGRAL
jgi:pyridoxine 4-dehydrogenase